MSADGDIILRPIRDLPLTPLVPAPPVVTLRQLRHSIRWPARVGVAIMLSFGLIIGIWGFLVPLAGGAVAVGVFSPDGSRKTVQHLEGGTITDLRVRDGDTVKAGQTLLVLENEQQRATYDALTQQRWSLLAKQARIDAERTDKPAIAWPAELRPDNPRVATVIEAQQIVFQSRKISHELRKKVLSKRRDQLAEQIKGTAAEVESTNRQLALIHEEVRDKETLLHSGLSPKPEVLRLRRAEAEIMGKQAESQAAIARATQQIGETTVQILSADADRADQIATESDKVRADLAEVQEKLRASRDILKRELVTAPADGVVVEMRFKTIGGVIQRGEHILDIVPSKDALVIEARITPIDVKSVHQGLPATIRLPAYSSRTTPMIPGTVESVSADRLIDSGTHQPYYLARVQIDSNRLHELAPHVVLMAGMPADVLVVTEHRTMFSYLFQPFREALWQSFREI